VKDAQGNYCDIYCSRNIRANLILWEISGRTTEGRRLHRLARLAKQYEMAEAAALEQSGYDERGSEAHVIAEEVLDLAAALTKVEPQTSAGVLVYARALAMIADAARAAGYGGTVKQEKDLSCGLAAALLRIGGQRGDSPRHSA